jgi:hypothetical protein
MSHIIHIPFFCFWLKSAHELLASIMLSTPASAFALGSTSIEAQSQLNGLSWAENL